jgi:hypothetical protein
LKIAVVAALEGADDWATKLFAAGDTCWGLAISISLLRHDNAKPAFIVGER